MPRVLVLDDDGDTLVFLGKLLSMIPVDAVPAACCAVARDAARTMGPFDIVIADSLLPDGDGVELALELKRDYGCATVIMSGFDPPDDGAPKGIDLWIVKPVRLPELREAIRSLAKS